MTISQFAKRAHVGVETIRFYQRLGLLRTPENENGGHRVYKEEDLEALLFIKRSKKLGFTLKEIEGLKQIVFGNSENCQFVGDIVEKKLQQSLAHLRMLEAKISELKNLRSKCEGCDKKQCMVCITLRSG